MTRFLSPLGFCFSSTYKNKADAESVLKITFLFGNRIIILTMFGLNEYEKQKMAKPLNR